MITLSIKRRPPLVIEITAMGEVTTCELEDLNAAGASQIGLTIGSLLAGHDVGTKEPLAWIKPGAPMSDVSELAILLASMGFSATVVED